MKQNAIIRIVCYSLVFFVLLGIMLSVMGVGQFVFHLGSEAPENTGSGSVSAADVTELDINWAAGNVTVQTGDTDQITFTESGNFDDTYAMVYAIANDKLSISYAKPSVQIGFSSQPSKDLTITVPQDWVCRELKLDGAAINMKIVGVRIGHLDIDGAACKVSFEGTVETVKCDGAACELRMVCMERPREIDLDGASCRLDLTLPAGCGFSVEMDGLGCDLDAEQDYSTRDGVSRFGDEYCRITADGLSCKIDIWEGQ